MDKALQECQTRGEVVKYLSYYYEKNGSVCMARIGEALIRMSQIAAAEAWDKAIEAAAQHYEKRLDEIWKDNFAGRGINNKTLPRANVVADLKSVSKTCRDLPNPYKET